MWLNGEADWLATNYALLYVHLKCSTSAEYYIIFWIKERQKTMCKICYHAEREMCLQKELEFLNVFKKC